MTSADEFYTTMGTLTQEMLDNDIVGADDLIKVCTVTCILHHLFYVTGHYLWLGRGVQVGGAIYFEVNRVGIQKIMKP